MFAHQAEKRNLIEATCYSWKSIAAYFNIDSQRIIYTVGSNKSSLDFCEQVFELLEQKKVTLDQLAEALKKCHLEHLIQPDYGFHSGSSQKKRRTLCDDLTDMKQKSPIYLMAIAANLEKFDKFFIEKQQFSNSNVYDHLKELCQKNDTLTLSTVINYLQTFDSVGVKINDDWCSFENLKKSKPSVEMTALLSKFAQDNKLTPLWNHLNKLIADDHCDSQISGTPEKMFHNQLYDILVNGKVKNLETLVRTFEEMITIRKTTRLLGELNPLYLVHMANLICLYQSQYELESDTNLFNNVYHILQTLQSSQPDLLDKDLIPILVANFEIKSSWLEDYCEHAITKSDCCRFVEIGDNISTKWQSLLNLWAPKDFKLLFKLQPMKTDSEKLKELLFFAMSKKFSISKIAQDIKTVSKQLDESTIKMSDI